MHRTKFTDRYKRNADTLSKSDQQTLSKSRVLILGLGGLGGSVCEMLARSGVGHLTVVDGDLFDPSNLNRQVLSSERLIGTSKAEAARERLHEINSEITVTAHYKMLDSSNSYELLQAQDVVVDCLDTINTRFTLQDAAQKASVPIIFGAVAGTTGQVSCIFPDDPGYKRIYGPREKAPQKGIEETTGNLSFGVSFVAALQASECIKVLIRKGTLLRNKLLIAELWSNTYTVVILEN